VRVAASRRASELSIPEESPSGESYSSGGGGGSCCIRASCSVSSCFNCDF
jgi:hypothetical protein